MYAGQEDLLLRAMSIPEDSEVVSQLTLNISKILELLHMDEMNKKNGPSTGSTPSTTSRAASSEQCSVAPNADLRRSTVVGIGASTRVQSYISPSVSSATATPRCLGGTASVAAGIESEPSWDPSNLIPGSSITLSHQMQSRRSSEGSGYSRETPTAQSLRTSFSKRTASVSDLEAGAGETVKLASHHAMSESGSDSSCLARDECLRDWAADVNRSHTELREQSDLLRVVQAESLSMNLELREQRLEHHLKFDKLSSWAQTNISDLEHEMRRLNSSTHERLQRVDEKFHSHEDHLLVLSLKDIETDSKLALMQDQLEKVSAQLCALTDQQKLMPVQGTRTYLSKHLSGFASVPVSRCGSMNASMNGSRQSALEAGCDDITYTAPLLHDQTSPQAAPNEANLFGSGNTEYYDDESLHGSSRSLQASFDSHSMGDAQWTQLLAKSAHWLRENSAESVAKTALMAQRREESGVKHS